MTTHIYFLDISDIPPEDTAELLHLQPIIPHDMLAQGLSVQTPSVQIPPTRTSPLQAAMSRLSPARQEKILRHRFPQDRLLSLGAGLLLDQGLQAWGLCEREAALEYRHNGKPYLRDYPDRYFNLSHSGNMVMAAFSCREVGCDIEQIRPARMDVAARFFTEEERMELSRECLTEEERNRRFARYWTIKESVLKVTGEGMRLPLNSFCVHLASTPHIVWRKQASIGQLQEIPASQKGAQQETQQTVPSPVSSHFTFQEFSFPEYQAAVCLRGGKEESDEIFCSFQKLQDVVR